MIQPTPYEKQLEILAKEAARAGDSSTLERVTTMLALVRGGQYGSLQEHFPFLRPIYRSRLGVPPANRESDEGFGRAKTPS
jgi:CHASE1-domain containing sensor protein